MNKALSVVVTLECTLESPGKLFQNTLQTYRMRLSQDGSWAGTF